MSSTLTSATRPARPGGSVSVVVISKDEPALADTLDALEAPFPGSDPVVADEIVVVDASDGRLDSIRDAHPGVRWIPYRRPAGAGITIPEQRNLGVRTAAGDVIVFTDAGCVPEPGWLARLVDPILAGDDAVACGRTGSRGASVYDGIPPGSSIESPPTHVDECPTINMAFRRDVFDLVDGFDESFDYGSDIDFSWRLSAAGVAIRYVPDAVVVHDWGDPARQRRRAVQYGRARARLYRKHPRRIPRMLRDDPIVAAYPLFLLGLPLTLRWRWYPLLLAVPLWRNRASRPMRVVVDHLWFGSGVLRELATTFVARLPRRSS
jgi:GT2 family glycosyltransferase